MGDTRTDLVRELEEFLLGTPSGPLQRELEQLIARAKAGEFHDFKSRDHNPKRELVAILRRLSLATLAQRVVEGDFDEAPDDQDRVALAAELAGLKEIPPDPDDVHCECGAVLHIKHPKGTTPDIGSVFGCGWCGKLYEIAAEKKIVPFVVPKEEGAYFDNLEKERRRDNWATTVRLMIGALEAWKRGRGRHRTARFVLPVEAIVPLDAVRNKIARDSEARQLLDAFCELGRRVGGPGAEPTVRMLEITLETTGYPFERVSLAELGLKGVVLTKGGQA